MLRDPGPVHKSLRALIEASNKIISELSDTTPKKGSLRAAERDALIRTPGGGGRQRAELLDRLNHDLRPVILNIGLLTEGIATLFEVGETESHPFNAPALTVLTRAPLEAAATVNWLLDDTISATQRVRRFLVWRFADLKTQVDVINAAGELPDDIAEQMQKKEDRLLEWVSNAKWEARPRQTVSGSEQAAALLDSSGLRPKAGEMPPNGSLVSALTGSDSAYKFFSIPAHGDRWAITDTIAVTDEQASDGRKMAMVTGFGLSPNLLKTVAAASVLRPTLAIADWNGVDRTAMNEPYKRVQAVAFKDDPEG